MKNLKNLSLVALAAAAVVTAAPAAKADLVTAAVVAGVVYAGERMNENNKSVHRESPGGDAFIRTLGVSVKDIKANGIAGGPNSVLRKPLGSLGTALKKIRIKL